MDRALIEAPPFGALLRQLRLAAGLSREALAERAGLSAKAIEALERGARASPRPATVSLLAEALPVEPTLRADLLRAAGTAAQAAVPGRRSAPRRPLPSPPSALLGREADLAHVRRLLEPGAAETRLVSLLGPGGVGKTRLALAVAAQVGPGYRDGAVFVDLAPVHDARLVAANIARALDVGEAGGRSAHDLLLDYLRERQLLLVLDNCEHLLGAAPLVAELLAGCAALKVLATSRSPLRLRVEHRVPVAPLASAEATQPLQAIAAAPAVQLFVERAQAVRPEFALTEANAADITRICRHLDGLPLAIELAAARVGLLQPAALLRRLERRLASLTAGPADLPERQRTLRNTLTWSYDLLEPADQALFRRLAVFAGGWTLDAAEAVCADGELAGNAVLDRLQGLIDASLVRRSDDPDGEPRFSLLQIIQEYAAEQFEASGEAEVMRSRHRDWYLGQLEQAQPWLTTPEQVATLDQDQDNYRAALRWTVQRRDARAGLRLGIACWRLWYWRGRYTEGRAWLEALLALPGVAEHAGLLSQALAYAGHLAYCQGDQVRARHQLEAALHLAQAAGDELGIERCAVFLGHVLRLAGELAEAERQYTRALGLSRPEDRHNVRSAALRALARTRYELGDPAGARAALAANTQQRVRRDHPKRRAHMTALSGRLAALEGDMAAGWSLLEQSLAVLETCGDQQGLVFAYQLAADTALDSGQPDRAAYLLAQLLRIAHDSGERPALARAFEAVAEVLAPSQAARAVPLIGAAAAVRDELGIQATPRERDRLNRWLPTAVAALEPAASTAALAAGRARSLQATVDDAVAICHQFAAEHT